MTSKNMPRATTSSFIIELPLKTDTHVEKVLLQRLDCARQIMNACTGEALKRLNSLCALSGWIFDLDIGIEAEKAFDVTVHLLVRIACKRSLQILRQHRNNLLARYSTIEMDGFIGILLQRSFIVSSPGMMGAP